MNSDKINPDQPQSNEAQSTASRYGSDFLAALLDSESSDDPVMPTNNQDSRRQRDICHCRHCQPVIDRLTRTSKPPSRVSAQSYSQQAVTTSQTAYYYRNRVYPPAGQSQRVQSINEAYHNRRPPTENPPMQPREMAAGPPRSDPQAVQASPGPPPQSANVNFQNMYYHQRPMDSDNRRQ